MNSGRFYCYSSKLSCSSLGHSGRIPVLCGEGILRASLEHNPCHPSLHRMSANHFVLRTGAEAESGHLTVVPLGKRIIQERILTSHHRKCLRDAASFLSLSRVETIRSTMHQTLTCRSLVRTLGMEWHGVTSLNTWMRVSIICTGFQ